MSVVHLGAESVSFNPIDSNSDEIRIGIVGCGPRGLQCLESLSRNLPLNDSLRFRIRIYETASTLGAGCVYDPAQPHFLRMNYAAKHVDFWKTDRDLKTDREQSLTGWLVKHHPQWASSDQFVPRAIVGEYLSDCFNTVIERLQNHCEIEIEHARVSSIEPFGDRWKIASDHSISSVDYVALTTGHEGIRGSEHLVDSENSRFVFPQQDLLNCELIKPGACVAIRGFGLSAIDAVLALTEGRGGTFREGDLLPWYAPNGKEPFRIRLSSRSGRPALAKPTSQVEPISDFFWMPFRESLEQLRSNGDELHFQSDIWSLFIEAAASYLTASGRATRSFEVESWFRTWTRYAMDRTSARKALLHSFAVATGRYPKDIPFALGEAWRKLYPQLVNLISYGRLSEIEFAHFNRTAVEMERIAFGPPAENVAKLLSLLRQGLLSFGEPTRNKSSQEFSLNAVIAKPTEHASDGPIRKLIQRGVAKVDERYGGVVVERDGTLPNHHGLAIFGRATEGWIVGNDSLSRTLNPAIERWAKNFTRLSPKAR